MKRANILGAVLILAGGACAEAEDPEIGPIGEPAAPVAVTVPSALPTALHGGTVLMAGQQPIEVVTHQVGTINAYHLGTPPASPQDAQITVRVPDADGVTRPVALTWDPSESRYSGLLPGAQPVPGPLELVYVVGGQTARASAPTFRLIKPAVDAVAALPDAVAPVVVDPGAPAVVVEAPSAPQVIVPAPPPPVVVQAPPPPPRVVVAPPPPPRVVVAPPPPPPRVVVAPRPPPPRVVVRPSGPPPRVGVRPGGPPPRVGGPPPRVGGRPGAPPRRVGGPPPRRSVGGRPPPPGGGGYRPMGRR